MCGRYGLFLEEDDSLSERIASLNRTLDAPVTTGTIHPGDTPPVFVRQSGRLALRSAKWGVQAFQDNRLIINARSETASQKAMFAQSVTAGRCLLPASCYFEWKGSTRMRINTGRLFYMGGLYQPDPDYGMRFVVLTQPARGGLEAIHDRMPLILSNKQSCDTWLRDTDEAMAILRTPPAVICQATADEPEQMSLFL